jgi:hypothetical protein
MIPCYISILGSTRQWVDGAASVACVDGAFHAAVQEMKQHLLQCYLLRVKKSSEGCAMMH